MSGIKSIVWDRVPLRYDLSFFNLTIRVHIPIDIFKAMLEILHNPKYTMGYDVRFKKFSQIAPWVTIPTEPGRFGYGETASYTYTEDGMVICSVALPTVENPINEAASLDAILDLVWTLEVLNKDYRFRSPLTQLVTVEDMLINSENRSQWAGLQVLFSKEMVDWIMDKCTKHVQKTVLKSMVDSWIHMTQSYHDRATARRLAEDGCRFYLLGDRRPSFDAPGNACDLGPDGMDTVDAEWGCTLGPHNVDSHIQQLTLLAGVAKLNELARASISKQGAP